MNALLDAGTIELRAGGAVLHCAPSESSLVRRFSAGSTTYVPADLTPHLYSVPGVQQLDLMALAEQGAYDRIYASHVMEHVPNDAVVFANMFAALKPGGEAWLLVPLWDRPTEDGTPDLTPRERERRFGQWDHVRQYGWDFSARAEAAGFTVTVISNAALPHDDVSRMAIGDTLFIARRPLPES